jgi:hypothetical protein
MTGPDRLWNGREWVYETPAQAMRRLLRERRLAIHHIDGDPTNNDPANLRVVRIPDNARGRRKEAP